MIQDSDIKITGILAPLNSLSTRPRRLQSASSIEPDTMVSLDTSSKKSNEVLKTQHRKRKRKRKRKHKDEETTEIEILPSFGRERLRRGLKLSNEVTPQQGKLDTNTFQCYFENIWRRIPDEKRNAFAYFDCLWFSLYLKPNSKANVLKWIQKKRIFSKKYVIVPIVQWDHWSLLIMCHMGESLESKCPTPCMLLLDSLRNTNPKRLEPGIRKFLLDLYKSEERPENRKQIYRIPLKVPKVPQQRNGEECGNFVLYYIKLFIEAAPESFSISQGYPYFMKDDWFTHESLDRFCSRLVSS